MSSATKRRVIATAAAILGTALAFGAAAAPAMAAPTALPVSGTKGSITIHKFIQPETPTALPNNGTEVTNTNGLVPLQGAEFEIKKVSTIDLTTNAGWVDAGRLAAAFNTAQALPGDLTIAQAESAVTGAGFTVPGSGMSRTTDSAGLASAVGLDIGVYLVSEKKAPANVSRMSEPFLITLPMENAAGNAWNYNLHVYPKNEIISAEKKVDDINDVKIGDTIDWNIFGDIPNVDVIDGYKVRDVLDSKLTYQSTAVTLENGAATLTVNTHYTLNYNATTRTVEVTFNAAGLAILKANNTTRVKVNIKTTVNAIGEIKNEATVFPNLPSLTITPGDPGGPPVTPPVETKWGAVTVKKTDSVNAAALAGATFRVYKSAADAAAGTNPITVGGVTDFVSGANGELTISGLRYSGFANGAVVAPGATGYIKYYLVETVAPTGYELLTAPIEFTVDAATTAVGVDVNVKNVKVPTGSFVLPATGGTGTAIFVGVGVFAIAGAVLLMVRSRRRQDQEIS
jgi:fimbrial isopeptide formation D2 family protein/LPXTG-motif cell wall-anchored protein